ncbi:hypothetical protein BC829DRAFT_30926 [Chytridium lagenaria]|nr:hypothetical protein BC829DRAFT_30926 [Chytridium lagenaria]
MSFRMASLLGLDTFDLLRFPPNTQFEITSDNMQLRDHCWRLCVFWDNIQSVSVIRKVPTPSQFFHHRSDRSYRIMNLSYFEPIPANEISPRALIHYAATLSHIIFNVRYLSFEITDTLTPSIHPENIIESLTTANTMLKEWRATLPLLLNLDKEAFCYYADSSPPSIDLFDSHRTNLFLGYYGAFCQIGTIVTRSVNVLESTVGSRSGSKKMVTDGQEAAAVIAHCMRRILESGRRFEYHPFMALSLLAAGKVLCDMVGSVEPHRRNGVVEDLLNVLESLRKTGEVWRVALPIAEGFKEIVQTVLKVDISELV